MQDDPLWLQLTSAAEKTLEQLEDDAGVEGPLSTHVGALLREDCLERVRTWSVHRVHSGRTGERFLLVRRVTWDRQRDVRRFHEPLLRVGERPGAAPSIAVARARCAESEWTKLLDELERVDVRGLGRPAGVMLDGVRYRLELFVPVRFRAEWGPVSEGWRDLAHWTERAREWMDGPFARSDP